MDSEMIQIAPSNSPQPLTEHVVVLDHDYQLVDLLKAIVLVLVASPDHAISKINEAGGLLKLSKLSKHPRPSASEVKEDDQYRYVVRHREDKRKDTTIHIHIESESLRDWLQKVLEDVCGIRLDEDKLSANKSAFKTLLHKHAHCVTDFYPVANVEVLNLDLLDGYPFNIDDQL